MSLVIEGALAANVSRFFCIPVTATYEWPDQEKTAVLRGVVSGPVTAFTSDPLGITSHTNYVELVDVNRTETIQGVEQLTSVPEKNWAVHTSLVTLKIG